MSNLQNLVDAHKETKQALYEAIYRRAQELTDEILAVPKRKAFRERYRGLTLLCEVRKALSNECNHYPLVKGNLDALLIAAMNDEDFAGPLKIIRWDQV